jgi:WD40 repeat protein
VVATKDEVAAFDIHTGIRITNYPPATGEAREGLEGACVSPDGKDVLLLVGIGDSDNRGTMIRPFDFATGKRRRRRFQNLSEVDSEVAFCQGLHVTPDGRYVVTVGHLYAEINHGGFMNQALVAWSLESELVARVVYLPTPSHGKPFIETWPMAVSRDGRYVAVTTIEEEFRLCDLENDFQVMTFGEHSGWIGGVTILARSGLVVTAGGNDETIRAWSTKDGSLVWEWTSQGRVAAIAASPSERYLVIGTQADEVRAVNIANGMTTARFFCDAPISALDAHPSKPIIAVGDKTGRVHALTIENCTDWLLEPPDGPPRRSRKRASGAKRRSST